MRNAALGLEIAIKGMALIFSATGSDKGIDETGSIRKPAVPAVDRTAHPFIFRRTRFEIEIAEQDCFTRHIGRSRLFAPGGDDLASADRRAVIEGAVGDTNQFLQLIQPVAAGQMIEMG